MLSVQIKIKETFLEVYFVLQPEGGVLLQHRGNRDGLGRVNAAGQFYTGEGVIQRFFYCFF